MFWHYVRVDFSLYHADRLTFKLCENKIVAGSTEDSFRARTFSQLYFGTSWTVAQQAPLSMGFSRQEYWSGLSCPSPGDLPSPGIKPKCLAAPALTGRFFTSGTWDAHTKYNYLSNYIVVFVSDFSTSNGGAPVTIHTENCVTALSLPFLFLSCCTACEV